MAFPSSEMVQRLLESQLESHLANADLNSKEETLFLFGDTEQLFAEDIVIEVKGNDFPLATKLNSKQEFQSLMASGSVPPLNSIFDVTKPITCTVPQVIGGIEEEWKAVILRTVATTKHNKLWDHEMVVFLRLNGLGKITGMKTYFDTQFVAKQLAEILYGSG